MQNILRWDETELGQYDPRSTEYCTLCRHQFSAHTPTDDLDGIAFKCMYCVDPACYIQPTFTPIFLDERCIRDGRRYCMADVACFDRCKLLTDMVNHPPHYTSHPSGIEHIQITEHMNFCLGNAIKYIWRADLKNGIEDLEKAEWYLKREIQRRKNSRNAPEKDAQTELKN